MLDADDVVEIKALGRMVSGYDERLWNGIRQIVAYQGLLAKFMQNLLGYTLMMVREQLRGQE